MRAVRAARASLPVTAHRSTLALRSVLPRVRGRASPVSSRPRGPAPCIRRSLRHPVEVRASLGPGRTAAFVPVLRRDDGGVAFARSASFALASPPDSGSPVVAVGDKAIKCHRIRRPPIEGWLRPSGSRPRRLVYVPQFPPLPFGWGTRAKARAMVAVYELLDRGAREAPHRGADEREAPRPPPGPPTVLRRVGARLAPTRSVRVDWSFRLALGVRARRQSGSVTDGSSSHLSSAP